MPSSRLGIMDPIRTGIGASSSNIGTEIANARRQSPGVGSFSRGLVLDVILDPALMSEEELSNIATRISGGINSIRRAPRNSLLIALQSGTGSSVAASPILCYPFFSPHLCIPVKPGESVWIYNDAPEGISDHLYWMSRVTEPGFCDDINYTHSERKFDLYIDKVTSRGTLISASGDNDNGEEVRPFDGLKDPEKVPGPPTFTDRPIDDDAADPAVVISLGADARGEVNIHDLIRNQSLASRYATYEIVPRYTKRPGDLVLQGSNNALICLGQDRGWTTTRRPDSATVSNASIAPVEYSGTVDIVAGRGRFFENARPDPDANNIPDTQPRVIRNARDYLEVDKNPASYTNDATRSSIEWNRLDRPQEGDPDFLTDASRIYVSMNAPADVSFNIGANVISPVFEGELADMDGPFIVLKSDEVRIIARKETERQEINGSIRIIKEGTVGEDFASVYLMPDGVVQITGSKIYIGQPDQGNGPGEKKSEPYVKYSELEKLLEKTYDALDQFCQKLLTHVTPGYGSPSPQINMGATELQTQVLQRKQEIVNLKSTRVFGE
jgi:hypothetical protein